MSLDEFIKVKCNFNNTSTTVHNWDFFFLKFITIVLWTSTLIIGSLHVSSTWEEGELSVVSFYKPLNLLLSGLANIHRQRWPHTIRWAVTVVCLPAFGNKNKLFFNNKNYEKCIEMVYNYLPLIYTQTISNTINDSYDFQYSLNTI